MNLSSIANTLNRSYGLLSNEIRLQDGQLGQLTGLGSVAGSTNSSTQVKLSDYGRLQSALSVLGNAVSKYDTPQEVASYSAKSSQANVSATVDASVSSGKSLSVDVTQLAQAQKLQSVAFADADTTQLGGGSLTIQFGSISGASGTTFNPSNQASRTVTISAGNSSLSGIATAVNRANIGISAKVVQDNGSSRLEFTGKSTGADQAFRITVGDNDGNNKDSAQGLSRLAYDPAGAPGAGSNLTVQRAAQNAAIEVDGRAQTSSSNTFRNVLPGISLNVSATGGDTKIDISRDVSQAGKSAKALVDAYNGFQDQAAKVQQDGLSRRISAQVDKAVDSSETGTGQNRLTLAQAGIQRDQNGRLKIDDKQFQQAFSKDSEGVSKLLANTADALENAGEDAKNGALRTTSNALRSLDGGDSPYYSQALQLQNQLGLQRSGLSYSPTTSNLYGLSQYLSISGL